MSFQVKQNTKRDFTESQTLSLKRPSKCDLRGVVAGTPKDKTPLTKHIMDTCCGGGRGWAPAGKLQ